MSTGLKLSLAMIGVAMLVFAGFVIASPGEDRKRSIPAPTGGSAAGELVRDDSPRLSEGGEAVFVEFLDFECEACLALFPVIEDLREKYGDRVTFVVRHMPLHGNSLDAAKAAEAAAEQGEFAAMYARLFEGAEEWGHQQESQRDVLFDYAQELGLDMDGFETAYDAPETLERTERSQQDGQALGVTGTPSFFLDGEMLQPEIVTDLEDSLKAALAD